jgi:diguanylate cyclase (GGDEF)-like protein
MLSGINSAVIRIRERKELLREACRLAVTVGGYATALVALKHPKTQILETVAWSGAEEQAAERLCLVVAQVAAQRHSSGRAADAVIRLAYADGGTEGAAESSATAPAAAEPARGQAVLGLPIVIDKTSIGLLVIATRDPQGLGEEELRMLREVAANLSFALQYLRKYTKARWRSYFDVLTGLAKRSLFCERLARVLKDSAKAGSHCAVAVIDIENLSAINDSFGRHSGDLLLQLLADRLKRAFQDTDVLAHLGGGTFAVVQATEAARDPREALKGCLESLFVQPFRLDGKDVPVAARSGVAMHPEDGTEPDALVQKAEAALRSAKLARERHRHYSAEVHSASLARVALERKLRVALEREQFQLHYQPKVAVRSRCIEGVEALIRWNDPVGGLVSPGEFLPILEASGLIVDVGEWVIEQASADCRHWVSLGLPPVRVAVNISPVQLRAADFVTRFLKHTQSWASPSQGLDVEITEGALVDEYSGEVSKLKLLRAAGVNVAIDDFGTGYSSLSRLSNLPIDTLKIDRCFISQMSGDARARKLVSSIISIARAFRMRVVAEGVEEHQQLEELLQMGCDHSQGYLHSKPVTASELAQLLRHGKGRYLLAPEHTEENATLSGQADRAG